MQATRRSFLKGLFAVTAVAATGLPALAETLPRIVGDGVHDDWAGLQACFDGKPFVVENEAIVASEGHLTGGLFRLSRTLALSGDNFYIHDVSFICEHSEKAALHLSGRGGRISNVHVDCRGAIDVALLVGGSNDGQA